MNPGVTRLAIVLALVVGGVTILVNGFGGESGAVPPPAATEPPPTESESPSPPPKQNGEVTAEKVGVLVQVLNGTYTPGFAADFQATLLDEGYVQGGEPGDAPDKPIVDSVVYFRSDDARAQNEADAKLLADDYLAGAPVERLPAAYKDVVDEAADVIVVLGEDQASG